MSEQTQRDIDILARTIYGEARGESLLGKKAVACCIMNRYKAKKWFSGKTISETCQKPWQFSCWNKNDPNRRIIETASLVELAECLDIAERVIVGDIKDFICGACHYHTKNTKPSWAVGKTPDFTIGNHLFYRGID